MSRRIVLLVAVAAVAFSPTLAVAASSDPVGTVNADIAKLQTDFTAAHDTLIADANKLQADAQLLTGSDKTQAKATIKADFQQLRSDFQSSRTTMHADWAQLRSDYAAAHNGQLSRSDRVNLRLAVRQLKVILRQGRAEVHQAIMAARKAIRSARQHGGPISPGQANGISDGNMNVPSGTL
ncbi:MAG: hypothetical protein ABSB96_02775 [Gaiellaceae bacterium]